VIAHSSQPDKSCRRRRWAYIILNNDLDIKDRFPEINPIIMPLYRPLGKKQRRKYYFSLKNSHGQTAAVEG